MPSDKVEAFLEALDALTAEHGVYINHGNIHLRATGELVASNLSWVSWRHGRMGESPDDQYHDADYDGDTENC